MTRQGEAEPLALAERVLTILDSGSFSTTYKLALLAALMDLSLEKVGQAGALPDQLTTRELAAKVVELYWPQARVATELELDHVLHQGAGRLIPDRVAAFRASLVSEPGCSAARAKSLDPEGFRRVLDEVEWTLVEMPLPKLQRIGGVVDPVLYRLPWDDGSRAPSRASVRAYQAGRASPFDNRVFLQPGVAEALVRLRGLLRPLLEAKWARFVAERNGREEARLQRFLFGAPREALAPVRAPLVALHGGRCFYCGESVGRLVAIDHFVPWSRHPDDAIENLVPTHERCNGDKRDFLAARGHVQAWRQRNRARASELRDIAEHAGFEHAPARVLGVARSLYTRLPPEARLWIASDRFEPVGAEPLAALFAPGEAA